MLSCGMEVWGAGSNSAATSLTSVCWGKSGEKRTSGPKFCPGLGLFCGSNPSISWILNFASELRWIAGPVSHHKWAEHQHPERAQAEDKQAHTAAGKERCFAGITKLLFPWKKKIKFLYKLLTSCGLANFPPGIAQLGVISSA